MTDLPDEVRNELERRWQEPHRDYHGISHLTYGLARLDELGAERLERIAYWCHDAVHTNTSPDDEVESAGVALELLRGHLNAEDLAQVQRLILLTIRHQPTPDDQAGARVCDADLAALAEDWETYLDNARRIRVEVPELSDQEWQQRRRDVLERLLNRPQIFHTQHGRDHWESAARANLLRELELLAVDQ